MPDNIGNKRFCKPWKEKVLTYDFQTYSSLGKEKALNEVENAFSIWKYVCNLKFERVFDWSQVMNIAFLTDNEKQNVESNCPSTSTLSGDLHFDNER